MQEVRPIVLCQAMRSLVGHHQHSGLAVAQLGQTAQHRVRLHHLQSAVASTDIQHQPLKNRIFHPFIHSQALVLGEFRYHLAKPLPVARMRDGIEHIFALLIKLFHQLKIGIMDAISVTVFLHAQHLRGFHKQVAEVLIETPFYAFDFFLILVRERIQQVLSDHFTTIAQQMIHQKEIAIGLQIKKPIGMDGQESHPQLHNMKSDC